MAAILNDKIDTNNHHLLLSNYKYRYLTFLHDQWRAYHY